MRTVENLCDRPRCGKGHARRCADAPGRHSAAPARSADPAKQAARTTEPLAAWRKAESECNCRAPIKTPGLSCCQHLQRRARMSVCVGMVSAHDFVAATIRRNEFRWSSSLQDQFVHNLAEHAEAEHDALLGSRPHDDSAERHERPTVSAIALTRDALLARGNQRLTGRHT